jgi:hypothetical protein
MTGWDSEGNYHDAELRLERIATPYERALIRQAQINVVASHLMQQIIGENPYQPDMEWQLWHRVRALYEDPNGNQLAHGVTPDEVMQHYYRQFEGE